MFVWAGESGGVNGQKKKKKRKKKAKHGQTVRASHRVKCTQSKKKIKSRIPHSNLKERGKKQRRKLESTKSKKLFAEKL